MTLGKQQGSLTIVGTGIKLGDHLTQESLREIKKADKVFAVVADSATFHWLVSINSNTESLQHYYAEQKDRLTTYQQMQDIIVESVIAGYRTCAVFYGHPGVFVLPSHEAISQLKSLGYSARMLPAISADACLIADLGIDPATSGCQSFEATDFLLFNRILDPSVACILWQIGVIAEFNGQSVCNSDKRFQIFVDQLEKFYPKEHNVIIYEAAQFLVCQPKILHITINQLRTTPVSTISTLYIPPAQKKRINNEIAKLLEINTERFV